MIRDNAPSRVPQGGQALQAAATSFPMGDARLALIRRRHEVRPCSMRDNECWLLAEVERLRVELQQLKAGGSSDDVG